VEILEASTAEAQTPTDLNSKSWTPKDQNSKTTTTTASSKIQGTQP
jgi:hypothetical protein